MVDESITTPDELPYQHLPLSSARLIHISSARSDQGGVVHLVSTKNRRATRSLVTPTAAIERPWADRVDIRKVDSNDINPPASVDIDWLHNY